ncbi:hypothetical protein NECAME_16282 [Necator americanus]|uniref:Uncharacterized protein n=1 Tax=Necator americanus TaxID=51031 RepID=W2TXG3_NECAM|nr:hypothetical protein NECAME_16282 [Necator americanus]ETN86543.1 hypothetical protein NECAME_16282 [Necator americanus]
MGDVTSVYRRAVWVSLPATEIVSPASEAFCYIPASRITFPGSIVDHLFTVGAAQFKAYVEDFKVKERNQVSAAVLASIHEDYNMKLSSLSDVFNFLTRRSNTELEKVVSRMIKDSLDKPSKEGVFENLDFVFFFKLVTCSVETLRCLIRQNSDAATPSNFFRGIRQLMSVDQRLVLSSMPYMEFTKQMVRALDVHSLSVVFANVMEMALDPLIFSQFEHQDPGVCRAIREKIVIVVTDDIQTAMDLVLAVSRLIEVTSTSMAQFKEGSPNRSVKMQIRYAYKLMLQLASLQRVALSMVCRECDIAISVFEEYRTTIFLFVFRQLSSFLPGYNHLFLLSFLTCCIQEAKMLFGDSEDLVAWKYESEERAAKLTEIEEAQEESFLQAIRSIPLGRRPNELAHSGIIGKGARHLQKPKPPDVCVAFF